VTAAGSDASRAWKFYIFASPFSAAIFQSLAVRGVRKEQTIMFCTLHPRTPAITLFEIFPALVASKRGNITAKRGH
jgi:hypothetical protein